MSKCGSYNSAQKKIYNNLQDFINDWTYESEATLKVFSNLTDESLTKSLNANVRTAGRLAWHITTSVDEMAHRTGLKFKTVENDSSIPAIVKEIFNAYKEASENLLSVKLKTTGMMKLYLLKTLCMVKNGKEEQRLRLLLIIKSVIAHN